jgi:RNA polymerase sigma-70 factor (ECF subfamily)
VVATLIRILGDFDLAEDAVQEAFAVALERWPKEGLPDNAGAWITRTARNKAIDRLRRERTLRTRTEALAQLQALESEAGESEEMHEIRDDRLRLIFTCCHPALPQEARVALTLRTLGGLSTREIARAFMVSEPTVAQRLVRAKRKIKDAAIPYRVPPREMLPERLDAVLAVLYLVFNEGYAATDADTLVRRELCEEAIRLTRVLDELMPDQSEVMGLLALMLLHHSRRDTRVDASGGLVLLERQDRSRWDLPMIEEGLALVRRAFTGRRPGFYGLQAAIAALHAEAREAGDTDWPQIVELYGALARIAPTPVVELNLAVAVAMADGPGAALPLVERLAGPLEGYHLFHSARADLLRRLGRTEDAAASYRRALELATNPVDRRFLEQRLSEVTSKR